MENTAINIDNDANTTAMTDNENIASNTIDVSNDNNDFLDFIPEEYRNKNLAGDFGKTARFEFIFKKLTEDISNIMIHTQHCVF